MIGLRAARSENGAKIGGMETTNPIITDIDANALMRRVASLYPVLPFHNFEHGRDAANSAYSIACFAKPHYPRINLAATWLAGLFHDAGYHLSPQDHGQPSKEAVTAQLTSEVLRQEGLGQATIDTVLEAILATRPHAKPSSLEAKAV